MQTQAVEQLRLISGHYSGQAGDVSGIGVTVGSLIRHGLQHRHALQHGGHFFQRRRGADAVHTQRFAGLHHRLAVAVRQGANQAKHITAIRTAQHLAYGGHFNLAIAKCDGLIGERQGIAHRPTRRACEQTQSSRIGGNTLLRQHVHQMLQNCLGRHRPQVELQAARQHGNGHLLWIGRGQHKLQILRRLFQRFQHRVEGVPGQHVDLVNHEDLEASLHRFVHRLLQQRLDLVHAPVGRSIQLGVVDEAATVDIRTSLANTARCRGNPALPVSTLAIQRLGQNARHRRLAHTARAREQICVMQPLGLQRVGQCSHHMLLPHHLGEIPGAVFAGQYEVRHARILRCVFVKPTRGKTSNFP